MISIKRPPTLEDRFRIWLWVVLSVLVPIQSSHSETLVEKKVKAAYIYNFANFITWPEDKIGGADRPMQICLWGKDRFGSVLAPIERKKAKGHPLTIRQITDRDAIPDCHILFIDGSDGVRNIPNLDWLSAHGVLTVSDAKQFAENCGMVGFVLENGRIRVELNVAAAKKANLKFSAMLIEVARKIWSPGRC